MEDLTYWLQLHHCPGLSDKEIIKLVDLIGSAKNVVNGSIDDYRHWNFSDKTIRFLKGSKDASIQKDLDWFSQSKQRHILTLDNSRYPKLLKQLNTPPLVLYLQGNLDCLSELQIAIVGTRNPSNQGCTNARQFSNALANSGLVITSGMALGIDGIAHQSALDGHHSTIAVMGTGLDRIYPAKHKKLAYQIAENGLLVSEFPIGTGIKPYHFPKRNRIIAGLSLGTLVVEAAVQSGSLITANLAAEQGREVFAIPGSIHNPLAKGCHRLIQSGAKLVQTANDVLEELSELARFNVSENDQLKTSKSIQVLTSLETKVLNSIDFEPTAVDTITERLKLTVDKVSEAVIMLELSGLIVSEAGGYSRTCE